MAGRQKTVSGRSGKNVRFSLLKYRCWSLLNRLALSIIKMDKRITELLELLAEYLRKLDRALGPG